MADAEKVVVAGLGYVGLPVAMRAVEVGYDVVGYDPDEARVKRLADGVSYVEDVADDTVAAALGTGRLRVSSDPPSLARCAGFYSRRVERTAPVAPTGVAELTKLLENTFRHVNIALVNELAMFANDLGIDLGEAIDAASSKPFGYMPFRPGPGVGGHCLPIDPSYLSWRVERALGKAFRLPELPGDIH